MSENPIRTCGWCKRTFELVDYDEKVLNPDEKRFMCGDCAEKNGVPEGWVKCSEKEVEVKSE